MSDFGQLRTVDARVIWQSEPYHFTPWLVENVSALGNALGMDIVVEKREADVGGFSLDILAKNLGTGRPVIIENQLGGTDHDHLGKLLTYAAGFDAGDVIWIATSIREEHRQALEWLNQNTNSERRFFVVLLEILQIDESKPAPNFKLVVFPNDWQKEKRQSSSTLTTTREERYRTFFQTLIDALRDKHRFTNARIAQPSNWFAFTSGHPNFTYVVRFANGGRLSAEVYIDTEDKEKNKELFDSLSLKKEQIEARLGDPLEWERLDEKRACRIAVYCVGTIQDDQEKLDKLQMWLVDKLAKLKLVFGHGLQAV